MREPMLDVGVSLKSRARERWMSNHSLGVDARRSRVMERTTGLVVKRPTERPTVIFRNQIAQRSNNKKIVSTFVLLSEHRAPRNITLCSNETIVRFGINRSTSQSAR